MAIIIQIIAAILGLLGMRKAQQAKDQNEQGGVDKQVVAQQEQVIQDAKLAQTVRQDVAADLAAHPDSLRDDDGFKRPD